MMVQIKAWIRTHPWQATGRALWVLFNMAWGAAAAGFAAWGPLMAGPAVIALLALLGAALQGLPWAWQQLAAIRGRADAARRWRRSLIGVQLAIVLGVGAFVIVQLYQLGALPSLPQGRTAEFERLWGAVDRTYVYFDLKGIDWKAVRAQYQQRVEAAESEEAYFAVLADMMYELHDAHSELTSPMLSGCCYGLAREIEDQAVVTVAGPQAQQAGMVQGSLILAVDGRPLEEALLAPKPQRTAASTPWEQRYLRYRYLLTLPEDGTLEVTFETPGGERRSATLIPVASPAAAPATPSTAPLVTGQRLPSGIGVIEIPTLSARDGHDLVAEFDAALDGLIDAPGLILDMRGNGGGSSRLGDAMAGRLLDAPYTYGVERYRVRTVLRAWRAWSLYRVRPRRRAYDGPVVVLIDNGVASSAEMMLVSLVDSGRAQTVGRRTAGASGNPVFFRLSEGEARFSTGAFYRNDGTPIEGTGIVPDVPVAWTIEAYRAGEDPDMAAAEQAILAMLGR
jgi:carboxyl-terminal processing protease